MATAEAILNRALDATGSTATLEMLQTAYRRACLDAEANPKWVKYTFTQSLFQYNLTTILGEAPMRLTHVGLGSAGGRLNLQQTGLQELLDYRQTEDTVGTPNLYATIGINAITFYPNPSVGDTLECWFLPEPPTLAIIDAFFHPTLLAGEELEPSAIPKAFHWDVLYPAVVLEGMDRDQRADEAQFWMARYEKGIARLQTHIGQMGGSANRAYIPVGGTRPFLRDQRNRGDY